MLAPGPGSPVPSTPERREGLRTCYWEGPSELPERRSSSSAPRRGSAETRPRGYSGLGAGPLGTPLGLAQRKRASPRGEAGTSDFLSVSDPDIRVPAELGQERQATSFLSNGTPLFRKALEEVGGCCC